jgi:uncharacterized protein
MTSDEESAAAPVWTPAEIQAASQGPLHPDAVKGFHFFNARQFFEAHEELETAWRDERGPIRDVYRGILQVGLAYYHILRLNYRGAVKMFQRCHEWLDPFPDLCRGIDLSQLRRDVEIAEAELHRLGPDHLPEFKQTFIKKLVFLEDTASPEEEL